MNNLDNAITQHAYWNRVILERNEIVIIYFAFYILGVYHPDHDVRTRFDPNEKIAENGHSQRRKTAFQVSLDRAKEIFRVTLL